MKKIALLLIFAVGLMSYQTIAQTETKKDCKKEKCMKEGLYGFKAASLTGEEVDLNQYKGKVVFTTSFGVEDQVITDYIFKHDIPIKVVTLDTGRLFEETYKVYNRTIEKYQKPIQPLYPKNDELEKFVGEKGPNSFYLSVENRKQCCFIRKVEPLGRALEGMECWITGIRAAQSNNRENMQFFEWDGGHQIVKYNPLLKWSLDDCREYVKENQIGMSETNFHISRDNSPNIVNIANSYPRRVLFDVTSFSNPDGEGPESNFMGPSNVLQGTMNIVAPIWFNTTKDYVRTDTLDFDFNDILGDDSDDARGLELATIWFDFYSKIPKSRKELYLELDKSKLIFEKRWEKK